MCLQSLLSGNALGWLDLCGVGSKFFTTPLMEPDWVGTMSHEQC